MKNNNANQSNLYIEFEEDEIQEFAECNFEHRLTRDEINNLEEELFDSEVIHLRMLILHRIIKNVVEKNQ